MKLAIPCATNEHRICRGQTDREFLEAGQPVPDDYGVTFGCECPCHVSFGPTDTESS